jgi:hypothetical protein
MSILVASNINKPGKAHNCRLEALIANYIYERSQRQNRDVALGKASNG